MIQHAFKSLVLSASVIAIAFTSYGQSDDVLKAETVTKMIKFRQQKLLLKLSIEEWLTTATSWVSQDYTTFGYYEKYTMSGKKFGIIKLPADTLTKALYQDVYGEFGYGVAVGNSSKLGFVDSTGKLVVPTEYDEIMCFDDRNGFVKKNNKIALVSYTGKILTPFIFDEVDGFYDNVSWVMIKGKQGYIDRSGNYVSPCQFNKASSFVNGFAKIYYDKWEQIEKLTYYQGFKEKTVNVGYTKSIPFILNAKGQKIFAGKDGDIIMVSEDSNAVIGRNIYINKDPFYVESVIDRNGKVIIPFDRKVTIHGITKDWFIVYDPFSHLYGVYNKSGKELLKPTFYTIQPIQYNDDKLGAAFFDEENFFYMDKNCKCVKFDDVDCPEKD